MKTPDYKYFTTVVVANPSAAKLIFGTISLVDPFNAVHPEAITNSAEQLVSVCKHHPQQHYASRGSQSLRCLQYYLLSNQKTNSCAVHIFRGPLGVCSRQRVCHATRRYEQ